MGPNGSGKSNLIEAICFVLGKASRKDLRAEKLGDLVYHGGKKLSPSKFAKVTIILDNSKKQFHGIEEPELKISRMVDKEGRSVYRVNGKRQPREYIKNILNTVNIDPDGYNIVLQGEIAKFIDLSLDERRKIIEDLSGISIYEGKKHKAMLELEKVKKRLSEARIIITEKQKHMEELNREKEQAEQFKSVQDMLNFKKASKIFRERKNLEASKSIVQKQFDDKESEITGHLNSRNELIRKVNENDTLLEEITKTLEHSGEVEQVELTKEIEAIKNRQNELRILIQSEETELKRIEERKNQIKSDIEINEKSSSSSNKTIEETVEQIKIIKENLESREKEFIKLSNVDKEKVSLLAKLNELDNELINIGGQLRELKRAEEEQNYAEELKKEMQGLEQKLKQSLDDNSGLSLKISQLRDRHTELLKEIHQLEGKKEVLLRLLNKGVQAIISAKDRFRGIHGLVSELAKTEKEYALPLKVAAGSRTDSIVVDNEDVAKECIEYLRANELGIATFLPLNKVRGSSEKNPIDTKTGAIDYAINLITFSQKYKNIFEYVFGDTLIVKNIASAKAIGINKIRMVTLHGDLIDKSGAMSGGYRKQQGIGFDQAPIDERIEDLKKKVGDIDGEMGNLDSAFQKSSEECTHLRSRIYTIESQLEKIEKHDLGEIEELEKRLGNKREEQERIKKELEKLPQQVEMEVLEKLDEKIKQLRDQLSEDEAKKRGIEFELQISGRDMERAENLLKGLEKEKISFENKINENKKEMETVSCKLKEKEEEEKKFYGKLRELYARRNKITDLTKVLELEKAKLENTIEKLREHANDFKLKMAEYNAKIEAKNTALGEYSEIKIENVEETPEELESMIVELEQKVSAFGNINMRALDVFREVEKDFNELKGRYDLLEGERVEVLKIIDEIELKKKEVFLKSFESVERNFSRIFAHLSPGGDAKLILENNEDPFEGGVDIIARPGGKKVSSLRAMSGGEKTLTALAFIFAVQEYNPSPFYIMDEVDAALDKENTEMLAELLGRYSSLSLIHI